MNGKSEQPLKDILTELKTLNKNVRELKEKEKIEMLAIWLQMLENIKGLKNATSWDGEWKSLQEKDKFIDILNKSMETIVKNIIKLAPSIKE